MFHFGYGSNLNQGFLRQYCPCAEFVMKAYLPNYEVQFRFCVMLIVNAHCRVFSRYR